MDSRKLTFQKADLLVIAAVALLAIVVAVAFLFPDRNGSGAVVQIYQNGQLVQEIPLQENKVVTVTGDYSNTIQIQDGKVAVTDSDCPGEDCVHTGWISTPGTSIICLPNRVEIRITGQSDVDLIVGWADEKDKTSHPLRPVDCAGTGAFLHRTADPLAGGHPPPRG